MRATPECPRKLSREEIIAGLKAVRTLVIDRRDAPELQDLLDLEREGLVTSRFVEYDEQSSAFKFRWAAPPDLPSNDGRKQT